MKILFASQNKGKQNEAKQLLKDLKIELVFPEGFEKLKNFDVDETGNSFRENAILKAKAYAKKVNLACVADDSGVIIDGLGGLPGIHSNRWFEGSADDRNKEVLKRLATINNRAARYLTAVCYYNPDSDDYVVFEETVEGKIGKEIIGDQGFDYDRIFIPSGYEKTFAQLGNEIKNSMSQRAKAYKKIKQYLETPRPRK